MKKRIFEFEITRETFLNKKWKKSEKKRIFAK